MEYIKKEQGSYNLHVIKTNAFKTVTVKVFFREVVQKENITKRNFLNDILFLSTKKYPTKSVFAKALQNLYAARVYSSTRRLGTYLDTGFTLKVLHDKYSEPGNFEQAIAFFASIIFDPNVEDGAFNQRDFDTVYEEYKADLESIVDDRPFYAMIRLMEETNPTSCSSYRGVGYLEDLEQITPSNLYTYYQDMLAHNLADIYVLGNVEIEEVVPLFRKYFTLNTFKAVKTPILTEEIEPTRIKTLSETLESNQTQLCISLATNHLSTYERNYPLSIYNTILGGGTDSLLFKEVREKNSLAYRISSSPNKFDHLILINGGIAIDSEKQAISIIKKQLKRLAKGDFSEENIEAAKEYYLTALDDMMESAVQLISSYYMMDLLGTDDIETKRQKIQAVTKEEVIAVANKVKINTIFILKGGLEHAEDSH